MYFSILFHIIYEHLRAKVNVQFFLLNLQILQIYFKNYKQSAIYERRGISLSQTFSI